MFRQQDIISGYIWQIINFSEVDGLEEKARVQYPAQFEIVYLLEMVIFLGKLLNYQRLHTHTIIPSSLEFEPPHFRQLDLLPASICKLWMQQLQ